MSKVIGLTGQIGSGKSLAASLLEELGAAVIDADALAREVTAPGRPAYEEIVAAFGPGYLLAGGGLDRKALAALVFADEKARRRLNAITHPRIREEAKRLIAWYRAQGRELIVLEAALLIESGFNDMVDETWLITAPARQIYARVASRDGLSEAEIAARLEAQTPPKQQAGQADHIILNDGSEQSLRERLTALCRRLPANRLP
jgi:dephospho-CoA kinase